MNQLAHWQNIENFTKRLRKGFMMMMLRFLGDAPSNNSFQPHAELTLPPTCSKKHYGKEQQMKDSLNPVAKNQDLSLGLANVLRKLQKLCLPAINTQIN